MKIKVTQKEVKSAHKYVISVPYCNLQRTLSREMPFGYTIRREGWGSDVYGISPEIAISTGYAPFGNIRVGADMTARYEAAAEKILDYYRFDGVKAERRLHELVNEFAHEAIKGGKKK